MRERGREGVSVCDLLSKSTKKSTFGTDPLSFNTLSRLPMATTVS